jgi:hypothetical protein
MVKCCQKIFSPFSLPVDLVTRPSDAMAAQWAKGGGLVADFPSDKSIPLDGRVGSFSDLEETAAPASQTIGPFARSIAASI